MKNIKTVTTLTNTNMEVLWLEPTCAIDGIAWEMTQNQLQSIKGTIPVHSFIHLVFQRSIRVDIELVIR